VSFFADGIYLGGPRVHRGTVTLARTRLGTNTFVGNHAVVFAGQSLPDDILLGVCTPADDAAIRKGSAWFGHPPFELPRREVVNVGRELTHEPSFVRYWNRVSWELFRFALPIVPFLVLVGWTRAVIAASGELAFFALTLLLVTFAAAAVLPALVLALKWALLGRVRPGQHPLWSCWCSRWDFLYVAWAQHARPLLQRLEGTLLLSWYLRAIGMRIGRRVVLGPGFAQVVDPDMIAIDDEATVSAAFQAHTFEDRVLKIDHVAIGKGATLGAGTVPLYGAVIGEEAYVAPHSVVMKRERLLPRVRYEGAPTRPQGPAHD
jgi:non-ribosomal peptide synthetase-like protein